VLNADAPIVAYAELLSAINLNFQHRRELGEVENKCTSHKFILSAISVPKIIKVGENLTKLWQKQF